MIFIGPILFRMIVASEFAGSERAGVFGLLAVGPLALSSLLRWLVLPRQTELAKAFVLFVVGVAMAESCALLGIFLGGEHRDALALLGVFGTLQWLPFFARRFYDDETKRAHGLRAP